MHGFETVVPVASGSLGTVSGLAKAIRVIKPWRMHLNLLSVNTVLMVKCFKYHPASHTFDLLQIFLKVYLTD